MFIYVLAYMYNGAGKHLVSLKKDEPSSLKTYCQPDRKAKEFVCAFQQTCFLVGWLAYLF